METRRSAEMRALFAVLTGTRDVSDAEFDPTAFSEGYDPDWVPLGGVWAGEPRRGSEPTVPVPLPSSGGARERAATPVPAASLHTSGYLPRIKAPIDGHRRVMILGVRPRSGATTLTYCLGDVLAAFRDDDILAMELEPGERGLSHAQGVRNPRTAQDLARYGAAVKGPDDLRAFTTTTPQGLHVLRTAASGPPVDDAAYRGIAGLVGRFHRVSLVDAGSGREPKALVGAARLADQVVVTGPASEVRPMPLVLDWLASAGRRDLIDSAIAVVIPAGPPSAERFLRDRFRTVVSLPHDEHLARGGAIDPGLIDVPAKNTLLRLAALVTVRISRPRAP